MKAIFELIGPDKARQYLEKNISNRRLRLNAVNQMVSDMQNGRWRTNGSPLRFDENGRFVDGQHRLHAVIKSNTTQTFLVVYDVPCDAHNTIDIDSKARSASDILSFNDVTSATTIAAIARRIILWNKGRVAVGKTTRHSISNSEIVEYCLNNDLLEYARFAGVLYDKAPFFGKSSIGFIFWLLSSIDYEQAVDFLRSLHDGIGLDERSPIYLLRRRLEKDLFSKSKLPGSEKQAILIKAWNLYRKGETVKLLKYSVEEEKPMPI